MSKITDKALSKGNSPLVALITILVFISLGYYAWNRPVVVIHKSEETSYDTKDIAHLNEFSDRAIGFKIGQYAQITSHHMSELELKQARALKEVYSLSQSEISKPVDLWRTK